MQTVDGPSKTQQVAQILGELSYEDRRNVEDCFKLVKSKGIFCDKSIVYRARKDLDIACGRREPGTRRRSKPASKSVIVRTVQSQDDFLDNFSLVKDTIKKVGGIDKLKKYLSTIESIKTL
jgi:hypothetical protein